MSQVNHHTGREYWRSLEEYAQTDEFRKLADGEFPGYDPDDIQRVSRRRFLKLMAASMALAGLTLTGCRRWPKQKLAPYAQRPENRIPGVAEQYATAMELGGVAVGLLATSYDGRPIKIEGNPTHPFSRSINPKIGASDAYAQASVLDLYDPDRSRSALRRSGEQFAAADWAAFGAFAKEHFGALQQKQGAGFAVLCEATSSPSVERLRGELLKQFPSMTWFEYEALGRDNELEGARLAFGQPVRSNLHLNKAMVVVSFDADLLGTHPANLRYAADWAVLRKSADQGFMSRVYCAESAMTITGSVADRRLPSRPARVEAMVLAVAAKLAVKNAPVVPALSEAETRFVESIVRDLKANQGKAVVAAGAHLSPMAHAFCHAINDSIGAVGTTVTLIDYPAGNRPTHLAGIKALTSQLAGGNVQTLLILGGNPVYDAPVDLGFGEALAKAPVSIHLSERVDETSLRCSWHLPKAHYLESWGDARAWDGTVSIMQPLIYPLFNGKTIAETLSLVMGQAVENGEEIVRLTLGGILPKGEVEAEKAWRQMLSEGVVPNSQWKPATPGIRTFAAGTPQATGQGLDVRFLQDTSVYDGRFASNAWLQELPDPLTKVTWDNAALLSLKDANDLKVKTGDMVKITVAGHAVMLPVYVLAGQPAGVVGVPVGYGRQSAGNIGTKVGFDTYAIRTSEGMYTAAATVEKASGSHKLALTQNHHLIDQVGEQAMKDRVGEKGESGKIVREASFQEYTKDKHVFHRTAHGLNVKLAQLFDPPSQFNEPNAWGMAVDMTACIGCSACVVACQAENNVPVVGKDQVLMGREMHWLRIDRYFKGQPEDPAIDVVYQPMMCVHCETAPCEQVCPVAATVHDTEGLNVMVYNRCIGTRYCSNNCPYKVRRFNYFDFHVKDPRGSAKPWLGMPDEQQREQVNPVRAMQFNPEVTVRMRGVMEKCTYCVQRIKSATSKHAINNEPVPDEAVVTACQQSCPTQAIVFGNLNDPNSKVSKLRRNNRSYQVLDDHLHTRPRTAHLGLVRNSGVARSEAEETR